MVIGLWDNGKTFCLLKLVDGDVAKSNETRTQENIDE